MTDERRLAAANAEGPDAPDVTTEHRDTTVRSQPSRPRRLLDALLDVVTTPDPDDDDDNRFDFSTDQLLGRLRTDDPEIAAEILAEANEIAERMVERRTEGVERRAATLQSATAIVGSFSLAGGSLMVTQVHGRPWQTLIGLLLLWVTVNLGLCGWRATQAAAGIQRWSVVRSRDILHRSTQSLAEARADRATQILRAAGWNARYARFKVTMLQRAGRHLTLATLGLPGLVAAVVVYSLRH
jgi:hypothetical protein